jgi:predicted transcriptional regulator
MDNPVQKTLAIDKLRKKREELRRLREFGDDESIASAGLTDALVEIALRKPDQTRLALISELLDSCRAQVDSLVRNSSPQSAQSVIAIVGEREYDQVKNKPLMSLVPPVPKDTIEPKSKPSEIPVRPERIH